MKCPVCRRGDELRLAREELAYCARCHILTTLRPGARVTGNARFRGKAADQFLQAIAERGMPKRIAP